jgi:hypothetical protein
MNSKINMDEPKPSPNWKENYQESQILQQPQFS